MNDIPVESQAPGTVSVVVQLPEWAWRVLIAVAADTSADPAVIIAEQIVNLARMWNWEYDINIS